MVNFISENPAIAGYQQVQDMQAQQLGMDLDRMTLEEAIRTRDANDAVDAALRNYVAKNYGQPQAGAPASLAGQQPMQMQTAAGAQPAPGPAATAGRGDVPGFQAMLQGVTMPPSHPNVQNNPGMPLGRATPGMGAGAYQPLPNATPGQRGNLVQLNDPTMPGTAIPAGGQASLSGQQPPLLNRRDLAVHLAQTPGTGEAVLQLIQDQEAIEAEEAKAKDHAVENFFKSIDAGDINSAHYWGAQAGMELTPEQLQDAELLKHLNIAGKWKALYGKDLESFGAFTTAYFNALEQGGAANPYSIYAANPPKNRGGTNSTKQADYEFLVSKGMSPQEAMSRVWSGGAAGGMKYSEALKVARDVLIKQSEGLPYQQRKDFLATLDVAVEQYAQRLMAGDTGGGDGAAEEEDVYEGAGERVEADLNGRTIWTEDNGETWYFDDDGSQVPME